VRATSSFPVPDSPVIKTDAEDEATCSTSKYTSRIGAEFAKPTRRKRAVLKLPAQHFNLTLCSLSSWWFKFR